MIKRCPLDLKRFNLPGKTAVPENQLQSFAGISQMELGSELYRETVLLELRQNTHGFKNRVVVRQKGFPDVESWKTLFLQQEHSFSGTGQQCGCGAAARAAADNNRVEDFLRHSWCRSATRGGLRLRHLLLAHGRRPGVDALHDLSCGGRIGNLKPESFIQRAP